MKKLIGILITSLLLLAAIAGYGLYHQGLPWRDVIVMEAYPIEDEEAPISPDIEPPTLPHNSTVNLEPEVVEEVVELPPEAEEGSRTETGENEFTPHGGYELAYSSLGDGGKQLYDIIYDAIVNYKSNVIVPTLEIEAIDLAFKCVTNDHPEIFYVTGYKYIKSTRGEKIRRLAFSANYAYTREERDSIWGNLDREANAITSAMEPQWTDYEKIKYIYDLIVKSTEYDLTAPDNQNIISVLLNHSSVCQGYAKTMQLLLNRVGVDTSLVVGSVTGGEGHAWNIVKADGSFYYVDCTWGDAFYEFTGENIVNKDTVNYDYLCVPASDMDITHIVDMPYRLPVCNSLEDNYYMREGLYFMDFDTDRLKGIFDRAYGNNESSVTIKCAEDYIYGVFVKELLEDRRIFEFLGKHQNIRYGQNEATRTITFWL